MLKNFWEKFRGHPSFLITRDMSLRYRFIKPRNQSRLGKILFVDVNFWFFFWDNSELILVNVFEFQHVTFQFIFVDVLMWMMVSLLFITTSVPRFFSWMLCFRSATLLPITSIIRSPLLVFLIELICIPFSFRLTEFFTDLDVLHNFFLLVPL